MHFLVWWKAIVYLCGSPSSFLPFLILWYLKNKYFLPCLFYKWLLSDRDVSEVLWWREVDQYAVWKAVKLNFPSLLAWHLAPTLPAVNLELPVLCRTWSFPWGPSSFKGPTAESRLSLLWCLWIIIAFLMMEHWSPVVCCNKMSHWNVV